MSDAPRWAVIEDADDLADVHIRAWQEAYSGIFPAEFLAGLNRERRVTWWRDQLESGARIPVAGRPAAGFCFVGEADDDGWGEVYAIYVHPDRWGEGLGYLLLQTGMSQLREMGHDRALLWVLRDNHRARRFYERQGWLVGKPIRVEDIGGTQVMEVRYETTL